MTTSSTPPVMKRRALPDLPDSCISTLLVDVVGCRSFPGSSWSPEVGASGRGAAPSIVAGVCVAGITSCPVEGWVTTNKGVVVWVEVDVGQPPPSAKTV